MAWYNASWTYRVKITIDPSEVDATLTDFPVYVNLADLPAGFHTNVKSDGSDIRVTTSDETTEVPREVVFYTAASDTGELHFKAPSISSTVDTDFYIYYGNAGASEPATNATYGAENVWKSTYLTVNHFEGGVTDSTSNNRTVTNNGSTSTTGKLGSARSFDGTNDSLTMPLDATGTDKITVSGWIEYSSTSGTKILYELGPNYNSTSPAFIAYIDGGNIDVSIRGNVGYSMSRYTAPTANTMRHFTFVHDMSQTTNTENAMYVNGVEPSKTNPQSGNNTSSGYINSTLNVFSRNNSSLWVGGKLDEFRIHNGVQPTGWIDAEYSNQNTPTTFYTIGAQEEASAGEVTIITQDISISTFSDNTTISQNHIVSSQDISLALTEDNTTVVEVAPENYTKEDLALLPTDNVDLAGSIDLADVTSDDNVYNDLSGSSNLVKLFKYTNTNSTDDITITWKGKTDIAPSSSPVYLQIYEYPTTNTYYFDASDSGPTDPGTNWTNDANAFDGSTGTVATAIATGSTSSNYLAAGGTNAPASGGTITQVRARVYGKKGSIAPPTINATIATSGWGEVLGTPINESWSSAWGSYVTLSTPSDGWTWAKLQALETRIFFTTDVFAHEAARVEIEVTTGGWGTLDSDNTTATDTEFTLTGSKTTNLSNYYSSNVVSARVYQVVV